MSIKWGMSNVKLSLYNTETGENLGELDGINDIQMKVNTKYETEYNNEDHKLGSFPLKSDYEMTFNCDTTDINMDVLLGIDKVNKPDAYDIIYTKIVQRHTHKKKRINKKWAKRYGYKQVNVISKGWKINTYTDGSFEFKKDII